MKKFFAGIVLALLAFGCVQPYDDSLLKTEIDHIKARLDDLEVNVASIQSTLGDGKFVAKVEKFVDTATGRTTGVTITYTTGEVVHFSIEPVDPSAGPVLSVMKNGAGELCWAIDGTILQKDGKDVAVYITPVFTVGEDGHLYVTVGNDTIDLGNVKGDKGDDGTIPVQDGIIKGLEVTDESVIITYDNGTVAIPLATAFELVIEKTDYVVTTTDPIDVAYTVKNRTEKTVVDVFHGKEFKAEVQADKIVVTPKAADAEGQILVYADSKNGLTSIVKLNFEGESFEVTDEPVDPDNHIDYLVETEGGALNVNVVSNVEFEVKPEVEWIHFVQTRSKAYVIELSVDENVASDVRTGVVKIVKAGTDTPVQTITVAQKAAEGGAIYLSKKGAANCYIVTQPGDYTFAAVKGNTVESVGEVAKAELLWETWNNTETVTPNSVIAKVFADGEFISFSTPKTLHPGNALIAAKDASGKILWSWHIWIPETEIAEVEEANFSATRKVMSRNLGALVDATMAAAAPVESFGLLYEWGRKDPFPGLGSLTSPTTPITVAGTAMTQKEGPVTVEDAIANPTEYVYLSGKDWLPASMTESSEIAKLWGEESKTVYDPCPVGYVLPKRNKSCAFWSGNKINEDASIFTLNKDNAVFSVGNLVFPIAGYIDDGGEGQKKAGIRTIVWSGRWDSGTANGYGMYGYVDDDGPKFRNQGNLRSRGGSVRCVVDEGEAAVPPAPKPVVYTDLSKTETANCYLVSEAGDYKFKAVKGNTAESVGAVDDVELLWETVNNTETVAANSVIAKVGVKDDFVTFSTPKTLQPGNALIAAKDASGKILWSWHIWIPATPVTEIAETNFSATQKVMSRNLGALVDATMEAAAPVESFGLLYEWGRKDPFPGLGSLTSPTTPITVAGTAMTQKEGPVTVEDAIANPTEYVYLSGKDWLPASMTESSEIAKLWGEESKTVYDPCPVGYVLPKRNKSCAFWSGNKINEDASIFTLNKDNAVFSVGNLVFPIAGYIDDGGEGQKKAGIRTIVWSGRWDSGTANGYGMYGYVDDDGPKFRNQGNLRSRGGSVRCVVLPAAE